MHDATVICVFSCTFQQVIYDAYGKASVRLQRFSVPGIGIHYLQVSSMTSCYDRTLVATLA